MALEHKKHTQSHELATKQARLAADPTGAAHQELVESNLKPLLESLHKALSAPLVIHRDQNGRAIGAGRAMN
jgi:hypothetical protein